MPDWSKKFKAEYDYARSWLGRETEFAKEWQGLIRDLRKLMGDDGFDDSKSSSLSSLRRHVKKAGGKSVTEDEAILKAVGGWTDDGGGTIESTKKMRAAALKLLRHMYLLNKWGSKKVWVLALPDDFADWPSDDLNRRGGTQIAARILLRSQNEHFPAQQRKYLANSTTQAMHWCQKTGMVLANAAKASGRSSSKRHERDLEIVKRWFADPGTSDSDLTSYIARLAQGFKDIVACLNKGTFILTDWVPFRGSTVADEVEFRNSEAFTFRGRSEGLDVVYIESAFFTEDPGGVLKGQSNWTRIVVHELTHLVCSTEDVVNGRSRYAWYGIGPHSGYPGSQCIRNADNWAFFAADCAKTLTDAERNKALKIV